jgi:hypothetical protein
MELHRSLAEEESSPVEQMTQAGESPWEASALTTLLINKIKARTGTWNIQTLYETGRTSQVSREMHRYNFKIFGLMRRVMITCVHICRVKHSTQNDEACYDYLCTHL